MTRRWPVSRSFSPPIRRSGADAALEAIDAALAADEVLCFCGCGRLVDGTRPSLYFYGMSCSDLWHRSQHHPDPEAWRAQMRAYGPTEDDLVRRAELHDMARPDLIPTDTVPSALDRLESRPSPLRDRVYPPQVPRTVTAPTALERVRGMVERVLPTRPRRRVVPPEAQNLTALVQMAVEDGVTLARLEEERQRHRELPYTVTYMGGDFVTGADYWRVQVGQMSEDLVLTDAQRGRHGDIVRDCADRLRARQLGRLE